MKRNRGITLIRLLSFSGVLLTVSVILGGHASLTTGQTAPKDPPETWAKSHYEQALDAVFHDRCATPTDARWISCIRIVPGHPNEIEYSLTVEKRYDGTIFARITRPKAQSVHTQLRERKKEHPRVPVAELAQLINLESREGDQRAFPGLVRLADELEKVRLSPLLSDETIMDATEYRIRVRSFSGDQMDLILRGPGSDSSHQPEVPIQWAESVRQLLAGAFH